MLILQAKYQRYILGCPTHEELNHALEEMETLMIFVVGYGESDGKLTARNIRRFINNWIAQKPYARQDIGIYVSVTPLGTVDSKASAVADLLETCEQMERLRNSTKMEGSIGTDEQGEVDVNEFATALANAVSNDVQAANVPQLTHDDVDEDGFFKDEDENN